MRRKVLKSRRVLGRASAWSLLLLLLASGCGKPAVGDPCGADSDCPSGLCLGAQAGFPNGYCSADCSSQACDTGQVCQPLGETSLLVCLHGCQGAADCREGTQCLDGTCQPRCNVDADCGYDGYLCQDGLCVDRPGAAIGEACTNDGACSSQACVNSLCVRSCKREPVCAATDTCVLDRTADHLRSYCIAQRTGAPSKPLNGCDVDTDCVRGSCVMGVCLVLCQHPSDCAAAPEGKSCTDLSAPLTKLPLTKWPLMKACLPQNQNFAVPLHDVDNIQTLLMPATTRSVSLLISAQNNDLNVTAGMSFVQDVNGNQLFALWNPADPNGYFASPVRHMPNVGSSVFLLSSSPQRAPVLGTPYQMRVFAEDMGGQPQKPTLTALYKFYDQPITHGKMPLRIHVTDLSGLPSTCSYRTMHAADAPTVMAPAVQKLREIYAQGNVQVEFDPITYVDSDAPNSVDANLSTSLSEVLLAASKNSGGGLDLVLVRTISPNGILGIAGGIPGAPGLKNNPRTGAVMGMNFLCIPQANYGLTNLAQTAAHELGHTLGLSHNRESNGISDPLGDGVTPSESYQQNTANLMYWASTDTPGSSLTSEQGQVIRSMPQVTP